MDGDGGNRIGLTYHSGTAPSISGYTPVGVIGYTCGGSGDFGVKMFDCYCNTNGNFAINTIGSIDSNVSIMVDILYLHN